MQMGSFKSVLGGVLAQAGIASTPDLAFGPTEERGNSGTRRTLIVGKQVRTFIEPRES